MLLPVLPRLAFTRSSWRTVSRLAASFRAGLGGDCTRSGPTRHAMIVPASGPIGLDLREHPAGHRTRQPEPLLPRPHGRWIDTKECRERSLAHPQHRHHPTHPLVTVLRRWCDLVGPNRELRSQGLIQTSGRRRGHADPRRSPAPSSGPCSRRLLLVASVIRHHLSTLRSRAAHARLESREFDELRPLGGIELGHPRHFSFA